MLTGLQWVFLKPLPAASRPTSFQVPPELHSQAIQVSGPMNEGCTGECEEEESPDGPFHSCILQIFIEYLLSARAWQKRQGATVNPTGQDQSWSRERH